METNKFDQLVEDLLSGTISTNMLQMALRASVRQNPMIPDEARSILVGGGEGDGGLIFRQFKIITETISGMELLARRLGWHDNTPTPGEGGKG